MANPMDALSFREMYGRTLRRPDRGWQQAFVVAPLIEGQTDDDVEGVIENVRRSMVSCIDYGEVHYVSADMTEVLQRLVDQYLSEKTLFHLDQGDLPSLTGFVYFDGSIKLPTMYGADRVQNLRAILWDQFSYGERKSGDQTMDPNRSQTGLYFGPTERKDLTVMGKILYTVCDTPNPSQRDLYGPWKARHWIPAPFGTRLSADTVNHYTTPPGIQSPLSPFEEEQDAKDSEAAMLIVLRILLAWTRCIATEIPVRHPADRNYDKVMHKEGRPPAAVKVTLLRRYSDTPPHGLAEVNWAYRWEVKGHHRWQRVGPGREQLRRVWVKKHVKGPADKPLVVRDSVTALVR
jgi:hypothetical protein